jgi:hypothetical protein
MKKLLFLLFLFSTNIYSQVNVNLDCNNLSVPIILNFSNNFVSFNMKGTNYKIPYRYGHVNQQGYRFSVYENSELRISTTYPADNYVQVTTSNPLILITNGDCKKI